MSTLREPEPGSDSRVHLHDRAMDNLAFIREAMERSVAFTAVSGWGTVATGCVALAGAYVAALRRSPNWWLYTWLGVAGIAVLIGFASMLAKARRDAFSVFGGPSRRFALSLLPPIAAGAVLTKVFWDLDLQLLMPGTWLLLYGVGVVTGGAFSVRIVPVMGVCFVVLGLTTFFALPHGDPHIWGPATIKDVVLAFGFGGLHIIFGVIIARKYGG